MARPGCVWTHSLLIDFADLAILETPENLLAAFSRPSGDLAQYATPVEILVAPIDVAPRHLASARAAGVLNALYMKPDGRVMIKRDSPGKDEGLLLAIWMQQWPRLRRSVRFTTFSTTDRSTVDEPFDLQVLDGVDRTRSKSADLLEAVQEAIAPELQPAFHDLTTGGKTGFRTFLRQVGGDVSRGRAAMPYLCRLFVAADDPAAIADAINILDLMGPNEARVARSEVVQRALAGVENLDDRSFNFLLDAMRESEEGVLPLQAATRLGNELWHRSPTTVVEEVQSQTELGHAARLALRQLTQPALVAGLEREPSVSCDLYRLRPDIATSVEFWRALPPDAGPLIEDQLGDRDAPEILAAIIGAHREDLAGWVARTFSATRTIEALSSNPDVSADGWLAPYGDDVDALARALVDAKPLNKYVLYALAQHVGPDRLPNVIGDDPWLSGWARSSGSLDQRDTAFMAAYLLCRGLGDRSKSPAELIRLSFETADESLANGSMPDAGWSVVAARLGWPDMWSSWDRRSRLRKAVVARFVRGSLDPAAFGHLVRSGPLFGHLADVAAETSAGRKFLERVRTSLKNDPDSGMRNRAKYIEKNYR
jgi:hypothetical protein